MNKQLKKIFIWLLIPSIAFSGFVMLPKKKKVVFFGDSITQAAVQPDGYIDVLNKTLAQKGKSDKFELIGAGISGNKVTDLQRRLEKDVLSRQPDLVIIYIGINDVWHFTHPNTNGQGTPADKFEAGLTDVITQIKNTGAKVVLCTPSVIGEKADGSNPQDKMLDQYSDISRKVAKATGSRLCDLRRAFIAHLQTNNTANQEKDILTTDGVHLNKAGNAFVAAQMNKFLK
jgi:lysophospholipase L1-like esterase